MNLFAVCAALAADLEDPRVDALAWAPDGSALYGGRGFVGVARFDPTTGARRDRVFATPELGVDALAVDRSGFVILGGTQVATFDRAGSPGVTIALPDDDGFPTGLALSPDGARIAVAACAVQRAPVELYDRATGRRIGGLEGPRDEGAEACVNDVAFVGASVVGVGKDGRTFVWREGRLDDWPGVGVSAQVVAASPDGRSVAVGGWADAGNVIDPATGEARWSFGFVDGTVSGAAWSPDGRWLAATWSGGGAVWDTSTHTAIGRLPDATGEVAFSPDSRRVAFLDREGAPKVLPVGSLPAGPVPARERYAVPEPVFPAGAGRWTSIAAAAEAGCGVRDGALACWGLPRAVSLESFPTQDRVVRVVAGGAAVCTLDAARALRCTGGNGEGQADPGQPRGAVGPGGDPVLTDVVDVAMGRWHTCAVTGDGGLWCWGSGIDGQLGGAPIGDRPGRVGRLSGVVDVEADDHTTCARTRGGEVWCFGSNEGGVLGMPEDEADHAMWPVRVERVTDARWLAVGSRAACAGTAAGTRCWGDERVRPDERVWLHGTAACGRAGGRLVCRDLYDTGPAVDVGVDAVDVAFGDGFACALDPAGARWCWGSNDGGRLGVPAPGYRSEAAPVVGLTDAIDLAVGEGHACAVRRGGEVVCWGAQPGLADLPTPTPVPGISGARAIEANRDQTCAVGRAGASCWGAPAIEPWTGEPASVVLGERGACAVDAKGARCALADWSDGLPSGAAVVPGARLVSPNTAWCVADATGVRCGGREDLAGQGVWAEQVPFGPVADLGRVDDLDGGDALTCALEDGRPRCWGMGALVPLRWPAEVRAVDVAVRSRVACLATADGGVACLGADDPASALSAWVPVPGVSGVRKVGVGRGFACALSASGTVSCWGDPTGSRLGDGTWTHTERAIPVDGTVSTR